MCPDWQSVLLVGPLLLDWHNLEISEQAQMGKQKKPHFQAACCLNIWLCWFVSFVLCVCPKKSQATYKQGRRLKFGMLTVLTNIRSTKVLHHASFIMHHRSLLNKVGGGRQPLWKTTLGGSRVVKSRKHGKCACRTRKRRLRNHKRRNLCAKCRKIFTNK